MKIIFFVFCSLYSFTIIASEDLTGKNYLCSDLLWGFEFISSQKVNVIDTDINNKSTAKEYYYETDFKLQYVNIYILENNIKNIVYSIHQPTLRVDIWTMTSGGITTREMIPTGFCEYVKINDIFSHIEGLKN